MFNKVFLLIALILLFGFVNSDSITDYVVKPTVPLDKFVTVTGTFNADSNANVLCKFLVLESDGNTLFRLTDEYTFSDGSFYTEKIITEPVFRRGRDYNVSTTCGTVTVTESFSIVQREAIGESVQSEIEFLFLDNNISPILFMLSIFIGLVVFVAILLVILSLRKKVGVVKFG